MAIKIIFNRYKSRYASAIFITVDLNLNCYFFRYNLAKYSKNDLFLSYPRYSLGFFQVEPSMWSYLSNTYISRPEISYLELCYNISIEIEHRSIEELEKLITSITKSLC